MVGRLLLTTVSIPVLYWLGMAAAQEGGTTAERRPLALDRAPVRSLEDPNPVFRAVAIDTEHGEVFVANDKESAGTSVIVYPTQFDPADRLEPSRRIAGPRTDLGMVGGVALSPQHRELYTVSGETGALNVFPLDAQGNVAPERRVDSNTSEIFVTNHGHWRETAPGEGEVRGPDGLTRTSLGYNVPGRAVPLGPSTGKFLPASVVVFSRTAHGDVSPLRTIQGSHTLLNLPDGIYRDPVSGELVVANTGDDSVLFFDKDASGDVAPVRVLKGSATKLKGPVGVSIDARHNELWVANWDNHVAAVFRRTAQGNVAPLRVIRTATEDAPLASMGRVGAVAVDPKRQEILAPN